MKRRQLIYTGAAAAMAGAGVAWWQIRPHDGGATAQGPAGAGVAINAFWQQSFDTPAGAPLPMAGFSGKTLLVNFWATWCTSCRAEMPELVKAYETHGNSTGLLVLGVNLREADARVEDFVTDFGMSFPVLMDRSGQVAQTWRIGGPSEGLPSSYFIDAGGVVQKVVYGTVTAKTLDEGLALILPSR